MSMSTIVSPSFAQFEYSILGVPLKAIEIHELVSQMERWIDWGERGHCLTFANVHVVMEAQRDRAFREILLDDAVLNLPDGMPLIWLGRALGFDLKRRVYGPDLMRAFCESAARKGYRHFFYGGAPCVPERLAANIKGQYPETRVVGTYSPPFRPLTQTEDDEVVEMINAARPDVLWLGLGCPKQEKWAFEHRLRLHVPVIASVGQAFDIYSGRVKQAPAWMRENGLEWFYRLITNPRRLWKRYLVYNSQFVFLLARERMGL
jgi:N-acetylglucosaminyldiphosphoundecaprenol N-acetyl-beta-D-mannosaminyltransferase